MASSSLIHIIFFILARQSSLGTESKFPRHAHKHSFLSQWMNKSNFDSEISQKRQNSALIPGKTNPLDMLKPCLKQMMVLNSVHETVKHLEVAEEFKYSLHMKQNC